MQHNIANIIIILAVANIISCESVVLFSVTHLKKAVIADEVILEVFEVILEERVHNSVVVMYMTSAKIPSYICRYLEADKDFCFLRQSIKYSTKSCPRIRKLIYNAKIVYIIL